MQIIIKMLLRYLYKEDFSIRFYLFMLMDRKMNRIKREESTKILKLFL